MPQVPTRIVFIGLLFATVQTFIPASFLLDDINPPGTDYTHAIVVTPWFYLSNIVIG